MSCNCNTPCDDAACDPANEPLSSALNNFIEAFFGSLTKTCVNNEVVWVLPCDLDAGMTGYPRIAGEGLACYFIRVFSEISASTLIKVTDADTTGGNLQPKTAAGTGIELTVLNPAGDEQLQIAIDSSTLATINSALQPAASVAIAAVNIDWSLSTGFYKTLAANSVFTFSNTLDCKTIVVAITNTAGNFTATWPAAVRWANGSEPVLTLGVKTDVFTFVVINGIIWGAVVQNMT